ncbi:MAG: EamA family transporter [Kiritimatiellae bacterium]|nr:EamA family transporter [Kiritimatiellia bacterium]
MGWLAPIVCSAVTLAVYDVCKKHSVSGNRPFAVLLVTSATGFLSTAAALAAAGRLGSALALAPREMLLLAAKSLIVATSWSLAYFALRTLPVTVMAPIRATGPLWTTLAAVAIFSEVPSPRQSVGFALAFAAFFAFSLATRREGFRLRSKPMLLAVAATLAGSASALYDKHLIASLNLRPETVLLWFMGGMTLVYAAICAATARSDSTPFIWRWTIPAVGILLAVSDFCYFTAIDAPDARISVLSTIRRTSTALTFVLGGAVFRERNLWRKGLALAALLAGVFLLCQ